MLAAIRQEIQYRGAMNFIGCGRRRSCCATFRQGLDTRGPQLSRPPRGYAATDPDVAWLRLKTFGVGRFYTDAEVLGPQFRGYPRGRHRGGPATGSIFSTRPCPARSSEATTARHTGRHYWSRTARTACY